ncbi:MAG: thioredoxin family protein [Candidatus Liptonbacteria bacterium]|nr:thioredoxin family protein [Candidatus Liptonbacteria bacterium]
MDKITVQELSSPGCVHCAEFEKFWHSIEKDWPNVEYKKTDITTPEGEGLIHKYMIFASPGIIVNGELFSTGGFHKGKFVEKLKELSLKS